MHYSGKTPAYVSISVAAGYNPAMSKIIPDWDDIHTVLLDMDGTLLDQHFDDHFWQDLIPRRYADARNITVDQAQAELVPRFEAWAGQLQWYCLDHWSKELGMDVAALKEEVTHLIAIHDGVLEFLEAARVAGKDLWLVTNAHGKALDLKMRITGLAGHFDRLVVSHDLGLPKENPAFWQALQQVEAFDPDHTLFIDDNQAVLESAASYGIRYLLTIRKPSSQRPPRDDLTFPALDSFHDILPD